MRHESPANPMLPTHLTPVARVTSQRNDAGDAHVAFQVTCGCAGDQFIIRYAGRAGNQFIDAERVGEYVEFAIAADCTRCRETHLLFDCRRHGWGPVLFPAEIERPDSVLRSIWKCRNCGATEHQIEIVVGWSPFEEVAEELTDRPDFSKSIWIEAFETIQIHLRCVGCEQESKRWVEFEVV